MSFINIMLLVAFGIFAVLTLGVIIGVSLKKNPDKVTGAESQK